MKITIDMDMTPEEARKMMGMPNLEPLQNAIMEKLQEHTEEYFKDISDPEKIITKFMPMGIQAMEQYTQFFNGMAKAPFNQANKKTDTDNT